MAVGKSTSEGLRRTGFASRGKGLERKSSLKTTKPMGRGKGFAAKAPPAKVERERAPVVYTPVTRTGVYAPAGEFAGTVAKDTPQRRPSLLALARGEPCHLLVPDFARHDPATSVAAHSNLGRHGKAKGLKAHDFFSVSGCDCCHRWLDQGPAPAEQKEAVFMAAMARQVARWRERLQDPSTKPAQAEAIRWALVGLAKHPQGVALVSLREAVELRQGAPKPAPVHRLP